MAKEWSAWLKNGLFWRPSGSRFFCYAQDVAHRFARHECFNLVFSGMPEMQLLASGFSAKALDCSQRGSFQSKRSDVALDTRLERTACSHGEDIDYVP